MRRALEPLKSFFNAETVAVIGASRTPGRIGNVILRNFVEGRFKGKVFAVNPHATEVAGVESFKSVKAIPGVVDLAVVVVPAQVVPLVLKECVEKGVKAVTVISSGFKEIGRSDLEEKVQETLKGTGVRLIGVNCLGVFDARTGVDSMFLPPFRLTRPRPGGISYISQSGAVGSTTLDWASSQGMGFAKFISYGNATDVDDADLIEFLGEDPDTRVIISYLEGVVDGRKFFETAKRVSKKKPIIVLKAGFSDAGRDAVSSHTGSLAGANEVYDAAFSQAGVIRANDLRELFNFARAFSLQPLPAGNRVQIITDGGGFGILAADAVNSSGLRLAEMSLKNRAFVEKHCPSYAVVKNPLDLTGDADSARYEIAIRTAVKDAGVDCLLVILLYQVPSVSSALVDVITDVARSTDKPIAVVSAGGTFTELHMEFLEKHGVPTFETPDAGIKALGALARYAKLSK